MCMYVGPRATKPVAVIRPNRSNNRSRCFETQLLQSEAVPQRDGSYADLSVVTWRVCSLSVLLVPGLLLNISSRKIETPFLPFRYRKRLNHPKWFLLKQLSVNAVQVSCSWAF